MNFDFWHGDTLKNVTKISVTFNDLNCEYRGNLYAGDRMIGDYTTKNSLEIIKYFPYAFQREHKV